jgi:nitroreductase
VKTAVQKRRSIRNFKKDRIPEEILRDILETARWSPSWGNTQSWELYVITGKALEAFKTANHQKIIDGAIPSPDIAAPQEWPDWMKRRYMGLGKSVLEVQNIARDDLEARARHNAAMFHLFDAPCLLVAVQDKTLSNEYALLDVGIILQTICLLAQEKGLGTCIVYASVGYPDVLRSIAKIPENKTIVMGVVLGYPDMDAPINRFERQRANIDDFTTWVS